MEAVATVLSAADSPPGPVLGRIKAGLAWVPPPSYNCETLGQGCQTHFHRGPHQPRGCLQKAEFNFRIV